MTNIKYKLKEEEIVLFKNLEQGTSFLIYNDLYMKTNKIQENECNAIFLGTGHSAFIAPEEEVIVYDVTINATKVVTE